MTLIKSISGIRGTIGGKPGEGLSPVDIVRFSSAYGEWLRAKCQKPKPSVVTGRDARTSGEMVITLVNSTLAGMGIDVISLGMATTPTVEIAVVAEKADGGIIVTASHNPAEWNALKLLDGNGEFLSAEQGSMIVEMADSESFNYSSNDNIGAVTFMEGYDERHIEMILGLDEVDSDAIMRANMKVALDCINSVGGTILPKLLKRLGVAEVVGINMIPDGLYLPIFCCVVVMIVCLAARTSRKRRSS